MAKKFLNILFVFVGMSSILFLSGCHKKPVETVDEVSVAPLPPEGFRIDEFDMMEEKIRPGEAFTSLMVRLGMTSDDAMSLAGLCDTVFDVRKMRAGNAVNAYFTVDTTAVDPEAEVSLKYVVYKKDKTHGTVFKTSDSLAVWNFSRPVETVRKYSGRSNAEDAAGGSESVGLQQPEHGYGSRVLQ